MNSIAETVFGLIGGLALFLFGMNMMSDSLQKVAGERMRAILALLTKNPVLGVLAGALTTAVLQSSSATTVMAIGFVSAGLMNLPQAISIIFGANIGTTITAQIIAFNISDYIYVIIFVGFLVGFIGRKQHTKDLGNSIFSFGLLFLGIDIMGNVMKPLAQSPIFTELISRVSDVPVLGVLVGTGMTLIVQSSSATIAVLQNFAEQAGPDGVSSIIGLAGAIPILLGDNIGTTITAILASIGQSKDAKRTAVAHCTFNVTGCLLFIWFVEPYAKFIQWISPKGPEIEVISRQIANSHTIFNCVMTLIWVPLLWLMVKIVMILIPDGKRGEINPAAPLFLEDKLISQPVVALQLVSKEIVHFGEMVGDMLNDLIILSTDAKKDLLKNLGKKADDVAALSNRITDYLSNMFASGVLTEAQAHRTTGLTYIMSDLDRFSILCGEVAGSFRDKEEHRYNYSQEALENIQHSLSLIRTMYADAIDTMKTGDYDTASEMLKLKDDILELDVVMRRGHMKRVAEGICDKSLNKPFGKILLSIDRMGNCCINIAEITSSQVKMKYFETIRERKTTEIPVLD